MLSGKTSSQLVDLSEQKEAEVVAIAIQLKRGPLKQVLGNFAKEHNTLESKAEASALVIKWESQSGVLEEMSSTERKLMLKLLHAAENKMVLLPKKLAAAKAAVDAAAKLSGIDAKVIQMLLAREVNLAL